MAAVEDFNPLRIRPYVALDGSEGAENADAGADAVPDGAAGAGGEPADPEAGLPSAETTMVLRTVEADPAVTSVLPTPLAPPASAPAATDLRMFEAAGAGGATPPADGRDASAPAPRRRRRPGIVIGAAVAAVVVVGTAGYASGLFSYESPSRSEAPADEVRAGVPDPSKDTASAEAAGDATSEPSATVSASPSLSASASPSASSASPSASSASPSASESVEPSRSATSTESGAPATESEAEEEDGDDTGEAVVLRRGDEGPEVSELQLRLRQLHLYMDDIDGEYGRRVEDAVRTFQWARGIHAEELGTYGPLTRAQLERETQEP